MAFGVPPQCGESLDWLMVLEVKSQETAFDSELLIDRVSWGHTASPRKTGNMWVHTRTLTSSDKSNQTQLWTLD